VRIKIVTKLDWPSFRSVAILIGKALKTHSNCTIHDWTRAKPGGNILFIGTVFHQTLNFLSKFMKQSHIVFYGTTEGHSFIDETSLETASQIKIVAVSNFVKQMLEESGIRVAGVVHHGLDVKDQRVNIPFYKALKKRLKDKSIILTVAANDPRKGLDKLLSAYPFVEQEIQNSFLILHSKPKGYYNLTKTAERFKIRRLWLTNLYGKLTPTKLNALYSICNIYVQPSYSEGFGLPILEAFKFDKPAIAVDAPPFNEIVRHNKNGILVPSRGFAWYNYKDMILFKMHRYKAEDMASAIADSLSNQRLITKMQTEIQNEKCHWDIHRLYPKLLSYFA